MKKLKKRRKQINWRDRMPYIADMMKSMDDKQIAAIYHVDRRTIRNIRKYHGLLRKGEKLTEIRIVAANPQRTHKPLAKMDFSWQNLSI